MTKAWGAVPRGRSDMSGDRSDINRMSSSIAELIRRMVGDILTA
jgi:hypothetical protein